jgi:ABC-type dipeptide/oligopeptide/nickel transport system permease component
VLLRYICKRLLMVLPVLLGVVTLTFALLHLLPGDPAEAMLARSGAGAAQIAALRTALGLDAPLPLQYLHYLGRVVQGDLGRSLVSQEPVVRLLATRLPQTLQLVFCAMLIAVPLGTALGIAAALHRNTWIDRTLVALSSLGVSVPSFWLGLMAILLFAVTLRWLPASGQGDFAHLILPSAVLAFGAVGTVLRTARTSMVEVLRQDYIRTARAKGLGATALVWRHALPNALVPVVTMVGLQFGWLVSGSFIVETIFSRQGLGMALINAILEKDLPVVQGAVLVISVLYVTLNLLVDLVYGLIDPRIRYE